MFRRVAGRPWDPAVGTQAPGISPGHLHDLHESSCDKQNSTRYFGGVVGRLGSHADVLPLVRGRALRQALNAALFVVVLSFLKPVV